MNRFAVASLAVMGLGLATPARAGVEIGGVAGLHIFADDNALGTKKNDTLKHANSALFAARLGVTFGMFGVELEGGLIPTESSGTNTKFDIYNVVVRAQAIATFRAADPSNKILPFALVGAGAIEIVDTTAMDSSLIRKERDYYGYLGGGVKYRAGNGWGVRLDLRALAVPSNADKSITFDFELLASLYKDFGSKPAPKKEAPKADPDADKDGITSTDECPNDAEDKDGFEDSNGCPDPDNDMDGIKDEDDKCPTEAEDKDNFEDDNGCPDPDNDGDGVVDTADKCIDQPETKNGFEDENGCPDEVPAALAKFTGSIQGINFKPGSEALVPASFKVLDKAVAVLTEFKDVKVEISGHTDDVALKNSKKYADNDALSQARAETVKAYFVKKGIADDRLTAKGFGSQKPITDPTGLKGGKLTKARAQNRRVEFTLIQPESAGAEAPKAEEPKAEEPKKEEKKADEKKEEPKADKKAEDKKEEKKDEELP